MSQSFEFGNHKGLDIIPGIVTPLENLETDRTTDGRPRQLKVPQVGWNQVWECGSPWSQTPLNGLLDGDHLYFVHSFYVQPTDKSLILSITRYGQIEFCSSLQYNKVFACQFHPERSGLQGLQIYKNIARMVREDLES
jgi:glutamine amidotransferase